MLRLNGSTWEQVSSGLPLSFYGLWVESSTSVWALSDNMVAWHWDGIGWNSENLPGDNGGLRLFETPTGDLWATGDMGAIMVRAP